MLAALLRPLAGAGFLALVGGWTVVTVLVVLPAAIVAGYQFPLLIALLGPGAQRVGREVGGRPTPPTPWAPSSARSPAASG